MSEARPTTSPRYGRVPLAFLESGAMAALSHSALKVYIAICAHAGADFTAFPSVETLGGNDRAGASRRGVQAAIGEMVKLGVIRVTRGGGIKADGKGKPSIYTLETDAEAMRLKAHKVCAVQRDKAKARGRRFAKVKGALPEQVKAHYQSTQGRTPSAQEQTINRPEEQEEKKPESVIPAQEAQAEPPASPAPAQVSTVEAQTVAALDQHLANLRRWRVKSDRATPMAASLPALAKGIQ